jgi:hypothetical protein
VFVANGDSDPMILPRYSYLLAGLIPEARLRIYPDAAHGFLFQHHAEFFRRRRRVPGRHMSDVELPSFGSVSLRRADRDDTCSRTAPRSEVVAV